MRTNRRCGQTECYTRRLRLPADKTVHDGNGRCPYILISIFLMISIRIQWCTMVSHGQYPYILILILISISVFLMIKEVQLISILLIIQVLFDRMVTIRLIWLLYLTNKKVAKDFKMFELSRGKVENKTINQIRNIVSNTFQLNDLLFF